MPKSNKNLKNKAKRTTKRANPGKVIYLDYAASALPNPSSIHELGLRAKRELTEARSRVAQVLDVRAEEIIFTSGGTESNNLAISGVVWAQQQSNFLPHIVTTNIEHPSVLQTCHMLVKRGLAELTIVPVEENGIVDPRKIKKALKSNTVLVSVMYANNEIGTIQPIKEIAREIRHYRKHLRKDSPAQVREGESFAKSYPILHTDAVQAVHFLDLNVEKLGVDLLSLSGSKIEAAGRIGVLYKKKKIRLENIMAGGDQEQGLRPGTESLSQILKFTTALEEVRKIKDRESKRLLQLRNYFFKKINVKNFLDFGMLWNGDMSERLPNNISITFPKIPSDLLVVELSAKSIMCSSKSACKSSTSEGSYVIEALRPGANPEIGGIRFSMGKNTTKTEVDYTVKSLSQILQKLKKWYD